MRIIFAIIVSFRLSSVHLIGIAVSSLDLMPFDTFDTEATLGHRRS